MCGALSASDFRAVKMALSMTRSPAVAGRRGSSSSAAAICTRRSRLSKLSTQALFGWGAKAKAPPKPEPRPTIIPGASYNIPISLLAISGFEAYESWTGVAAFTALLGVFLSIQATRIRWECGIRTQEREWCSLAGLRAAAAHGVFHAYRYG